MRTSLFLSSLFAVSLIGGVALAEAPAAIRRAPSALQPSRSHGDTVDKSYATEHTAAATARGATTQALPNRQHASPSAAKAASRVNCSTDGSVDCGRNSARATSTAQPSGAKNATRASSRNPFDNKENERVNCNEGDQCSASSKGAKAIWSKSRGSAGAAEAPSIAKQAEAAMDRHDGQAGSARMSCNEGEECSFSSKEAKKIWRSEAFKKGTVNASAPGNNFTDAKKAMKDAMTRAHYGDEHHNH